MSKTNRKTNKKSVDNTNVHVDDFDQLAPLEIETLTNNQKRYLNSLKNNILTISTGYAGTGKSYVATAYAAEQIKAKRITKLLITRPIQEAGESLGFLPGTIDEKVEPYVRPVLDILIKRLGKSFTEYLFKRNVIEFVPLAYMRGKSFNDAIIIADEMQNSTPTQCMMLLSRVGDNCKVIVNGDIHQCDIKGKSGLPDLVSRMKTFNSVGWVDFTVDDIVRSGFCKDVILAYSDLSTD